MEQVVTAPERSGLTLREHVRRAPWPIMIAYLVAIGWFAELVRRWSFPTRYLGDDFTAEWVRRFVENFFSMPHWGFPSQHIVFGLASWLLLLAPLWFHERRRARTLAWWAVGYLLALSALLHLPTR